MKSKKFFAWLLACLVLTCLLPTMAFAAEAEPKPVAQVGDKTYDTLAAAIEAASEGGTVTLLDDVKATGNTFISKSITLNLNGYTIASTGQSALCIYDTEEKVNVTVKNGTLTGGTVCTMWAYATADLTLEGVTVESADGAGGIYDYGTKSSVTLNNCNVSGDYFAVYHNGSTAGFTLTASNSTITAIEGSVPDACAIYVSGNSTNTAENAHGMNSIGLTGCTVTGPTGIEGKYTNMNLTDCDITATVDIDFSQNNNGSTGLGFAVVSTDNSMEPNTPAPGATITINGGSYTGVIGLSQFEDYKDSEDFKEADYIVNGGTFSGDVSDYLAEDVKDVEYNTVLEPATCTKNGVGKLVKTVNGETTTSYYVIPAAHKWVAVADAEANKKATCGEAVAQVYKCSACTETKTEEIPATGKHTWKEEQTIEATCTEPAKVGKICSVCETVGETAVVEGDNKPLGHEMKLDTGNKNYKAATCTEGGVDTMKCSRCDVTEEKATEALGHKWDDGEYVEAGCENGAGVKYTCKAEGCGETMVEELTGELAQPALGHDYKAVVTAPTCQKEGYTTYACSRCEKEYTDNKVPADPSAHKYSLTATLKEATCTDTGIGKYTCEYCQAAKYMTIEITHTWNAGEVTKAATCGVAGEKKLTCTKCSETKTEVIPATGKHAWNEEQTIEATCTEPAKVGKSCTVCKAADGELQPVTGSKPLGHDLQLNKENENYKEATCTEGGVDTYKCSRCDYTEEKATEALGHTWGEGDHQEADCTTASGVKYTCSKCNETMVEEYPEGVGEPALGHKPVAMEDVAATCKEAGSTGGVKCSVCNEILEQPTEIPVDATAHKAKLTKPLKEATCTAAGIGKYTCELCGEALGYKTIPADHTWDEGKVTTAATCAEDGEKTFTCSVCQETKTEAIPATGEHTFVEGVIAADCTEPAKVGQKCSVCEAEGETTPVEGSKPLGHDLALDTANENYKAATCAEGGVDTFKCSRCGYTEEKATEALGHTWGEEKHSEADCVNPAGAKKTCTVCGEVAVVPFEGELAQPALGHQEQAVEDVAANCQKTGLTGKVVCSVCGEVLNPGTEIPVDENAHEYGEPKVLKKATCAATGIGKYVCKCGKYEYKVIPMVEHTIDETKYEVTKKATCTEPGVMTFTCSVCEGEVTKEIAATGHKWSDEKVGEDENGEFIYKECENGCNEREIISRVECKHKTTETIPGKEATCTETGLTEGVKCSACGEILTAQEEIAMIDHTYDEGEITKEPTATEDGEKTYTCAVCGGTKTEAIPATGEVECKHETTETIPGKEATCTETGLTEGVKCSACGETLTAQEEIPATGRHHYEYVFSEDGKTLIYTCSDCGDSFTEPF